MIHLLLGKEEGEKESFVKILEEKAKNNFKEINKERFFLNETSLEEVVNLALTSGLFSYYNFFICYRAESIDKNKNTEKLISWCLNSENNTIIFISEENKVKIQELIPKNEVKIFWEIDDSKKKAFIESYLNKNRGKVSAEGVEHLVLSLENNTKTIKNELDKLLSFSNEVLEIEEIEDFLSHSRDENVFTMLFHIFKREGRLALKSLDLILKKHSASTSFYPLIIILEGQLKKALAVLEKYRETKNLQSSLASCKILGKRQTESFTFMVKNYSRAELIKAIKICSKLSLISRQTPKLEKFYIEEFILELIFKKKKSIFFRPRKLLFDSKK